MKEWIIDELKDFFHDEQSFKAICEDRIEFRKWLDRMLWHVKKCDELSDVLRKAEITAFIDKGGIFQGIYVPPELKDAKVDIIDYVTEDGDEIEKADETFEAANKKVETGELVFINY